MKCDVVRGSHLDLFDRCPLAYRYTVHEGRLPDVKIPKWAVLGWVIHKTLDDVVTSGIDEREALTLNLRHYAEIAEREWKSTYPGVPIARSEIPPISDNDARRAVEMMYNFSKLRRLKSFINLAESRETEVAFEVSLDVGGTIKLRGRIDLLVKSGGRYYIFDYKSSKRAWEHQVVPPQLLRYAIAISVLRNVSISLISGTIVNLESGRLLTKEWGSREANDMIASVVGKVEAIRAMPPEGAAGVFESHCRTLCQYHPSCPVFRTANA